MLQNYGLFKITVLYLLKRVRYLAIYLVLEMSKQLQIINIIKERNTSNWISINKQIIKCMHNATEIKCKYR